MVDTKSNLIDAVIVAAGIGARMGASCPKQYLSLGDKTILEHTICALLKVSLVNQIVLVLHPQDSYFQKSFLFNHPKIKITTGGKERVDSVLNGLKQVQTKWCLVHDAARPFVSQEDVEQLCAQVLASTDLSIAGGILAHKAADTLKQASSNTDAMPMIDKTINRSFIWQAMTPQMFKTQELITAIEQALESKANITDEASALEFVGGKVLLVAGSSLNFKITTPADLTLAQALLTYLNQNKA